jgi:hypothetical protein
LNYFPRGSPQQQSIISLNERLLLTLATQVYSNSCLHFSPHFNNFSDSKETQEASKPPPPVKIKTPKKSSNNQKSLNKNAIADTTISVTERVDETSLHLRSSPTEGVNNVVGGGNVGHEKFAFSQLMRQMALKYQDKNETAER